PGSPSEKIVAPPRYCSSTPMSTTRLRWPCGRPLNRSICARISRVDFPLRSSSAGLGSASDMDSRASHDPSENAKDGPRAVLSERDQPRSDLEHENERDQERVDDERLDQREAENHRREDLALGAGVTRDALECRAGRASLTDATAERGQADRETGAER